MFPPGDDGVGEEILRFLKTTAKWVQRFKLWLNEGKGSTSD